MRAQSFPRYFGVKHCNQPLPRKRIALHRPLPSRYMIGVFFEYERLHTRVNFFWLDEKNRYVEQTEVYCILYESVIIKSSPSSKDILAWNGGTSPRSCMALDSRLSHSNGWNARVSFCQIVHKNHESGLFCRAYIEEESCCSRKAPDFSICFLRRNITQSGTGFSSGTSSVSTAPNGNNVSTPQTLRQTLCVTQPQE